jgi:hypothetical protein
VNLAERVVLEMGFVWNVLHIESGIDATIEIRDPATGVTTNRIIQAQVKAVTEFNADSAEGFSFSCDRAHIRYWLGGTAPVILLVCRPDTGEIYWKHLNHYFSLPENRDRVTVRFSKVADQLHASSSAALVAVAKPEGGLALGPLPKPERLMINLFGLSGYPSEIVVTQTVATDWTNFFENLKEQHKPWLREFIWKGGVRYSFFDPAAEGIAELCDHRLDPIPTDEWARSSDPVLQRSFAELLGRTFEACCYRRGIAVDRGSGVFYFTAPVDGSERVIATKSLANVTSKTVVSKHSSIREDGTPSVYYKHFAFDGRMRRFDLQWYFELTPTYHFTEDGVKPYPYADALLTGIKRLERHSAVLGLFLTWKEFLTEDSLFNFSYRYLRIAAPLMLQLDGGIDDTAWLRSTPSEEPTSDIEADDDSAEAETDGDDSLFSWKPN